MKLRKVLSSLVLLSVVASGAFATVPQQPALNTPKSDKGAEIDALYGGYKYKTINSTTETVICTGRCLLVEAYMSTGPNTTTVKFRDTIAADGAGTNLMFPRLRYLPDNTAARVPTLARPIRSANGGITAQLSSVSANEEIVVVYLDNL